MGNDDHENQVKVNYQDLVAILENAEDDKDIDNVIMNNTSGETSKGCAVAAR